jgi:hypothetical protein
MWHNPNNEETIEMKMAQSIMESATKMNDPEWLTNIVSFVVNVLKTAGLAIDTGRDKDPARNEQIIMMDWFNKVEQRDVSPGDVISYPANGEETLGLIESYDPATKTGKMYAMDDSLGRVSSIDFTETDIEGGGFLRPKIELFTGNLADLCAGTNNDYDEDQYMGPSYPSPSP